MTDTIRMLLYGESGTGKTTFWATFPGPILALICSGSNKPGELKSIDTPEYRKKINPQIVNSVEQFQDLLNSSDKYETVVLDHASGFADLVIKELLGLDELPVTKTRVAGKGESWSLVSQQQYGQLAVICKEKFRSLLNLPCNVVIVAQERVFGGREDGLDSELIKPTIGAGLTPSVAKWLNPACDYVVQTFKRPKMQEVSNTIGGKVVKTMERAKGVEYCLRVGPHDTYMTKFRIPKDRNNALPESIVNPEYGKITKLLSGA